MLSDVFGGSGHTTGSAVGSRFHRALGVEQPDGAIWSNQPMLEIERSTVSHRLLHDTVYAGAIRRVHSLEERLVGGSKLSRFQAIDAVKLVRPCHLIGENIPLPTGDGTRRMANPISWMRRWRHSFAFGTWRPISLIPQAQPPLPNRLGASPRAEEDGRKVDAPAAAVGFVQADVMLLSALAMKSRCRSRGDIRK